MISASQHVWMKTVPSLPTGKGICRSRDIKSRKYRQEQPAVWTIKDVNETDAKCILFFWFCAIYGLWIHVL
jgi:hypothetical protein